MAEGKKHIIVPEKVYELDDDAFDDDAVLDEGYCDKCDKPYEASALGDHCIEEGTCWDHCAKPVEHLIAQMKPWAAVNPPAWGTAGNPLPVPDEEEPAPVLPKGVEKSQFLKELSADALVDYVMRDMGAPEVGREATPSEVVALYMTKVWLEAEGQHAEVVAYSEGTSIANHRKAHPECPTCANLSYYDKAFDILRVEARQEIEQAEIRRRQAQFTQMGVCVECGKPPVEGRRYTLDDGGGFMCANCCGPHLLMDDGQPGNPWQQGG